MGDALNLLEETAGRVLPAGYAVDYAGQSRQFQLSSSSLALTFVLALAFIYLVLAAQFESFRDPFIIMLTVPLSMTGALLALLLSGGTLNVYSQIGWVIVGGLLLGTFFTLFVVPTVYTLLAGRKPVAGEQVAALSVEVV
jgi:multidrug efflux pump